MRTDNHPRGIRVDLRRDGTPRRGRGGRREERDGELSVEYPQIEGNGGATVARFNQMILAGVKEDAAAYRKEILKAGGGMFDLSYEVRLANDDLISVVFNYYSRYGTPPGCDATSETLNYDLTRGRLVEFEEMFGDGADYTQLLRDYCLRDLKKRWGTEWVTEDKLRLYVEKVVGDKGKWTLRPKGLDLSLDSPEMHPSARLRQTSSCLTPLSAE